MSVEEEVRALNEKRMNIVSLSREILTRAASEKRELTHEESTNHDKAMDDITRIDKTREALLASSRAEEEFQRVNDELQRVATPEERADLAARDKKLEEQIDSFFRRGIRQPGPNAVEIDLTVPAKVYSMARNGIPLNELRALQSDGGSSGGSLTV